MGPRTAGAGVMSRQTDMGEDVELHHEVRAKGFPQHPRAARRGEEARRGGPTKSSCVKKGPKAERPKGATHTHTAYIYILTRSAESHRGWSRRARCHVPDAVISPCTYPPPRTSLCWRAKKVVDLAPLHEDLQEAKVAPAGQIFQITPAPE